MWNRLARLCRVKRPVALAAAAALLVVVLGLLWGGRTLAKLDARVEERFSGRLFSIPSTVYAAPLVLYPGMEVRRVGLSGRLERLRYRLASGSHVRLGEFARLPGRIRIGRRAFELPSRSDEGGVVDLLLDRDGRIEKIRDARGRYLPLVELEPEVLGQLHGAARADRRLVRLDEIPPVLVDAILAIEDQRFFEHPCVDVRRVFGALLANVRARRIVQGASTLTQQLVKNFYLGPERTLRRKFREAVMACLLERRHTKEEILEVYLNEVYVGQRGSVAIHGVGEAAFHYFAKDVSDLTLAESALIAGLIKGPNLYSPYANPATALARRDLVLEVLRAQGAISEAEYEQGVAEPIHAEIQPEEENPAPYFVEHLRQDLAAVYGDEILESEGLGIYSTFDPHLQRVANRSLQAGLERLESRFPQLLSEDSPLQGALVALVPRTGEILALVGGRDYAKSQFNRATRAHRQPGSVFKPVVALAALSRRGDGPPSHTLVSPLLDEPLEVDTPQGVWAPVNYDEEFRGLVTVRNAIEQSLNVPVARLGLEVGLERIIETARKMGLAGPLQPVPSLALGVFEVTLLEVARAYAVLAAEGVRPTVRTYRQVQDQEGTVLERQPLQFERVFDADEVYLVTSVLQGVVDRGTGRAVRRLGVHGPVAGKTGTTSAYRDAWFVGYTPDLLVAVWIGFDDGRSLDVPGSVAALPVVADFLLSVLGPEGWRSFDPPPGIVRVAYEPDSGPQGNGGSFWGPESFLDGTEPVRRSSETPVERALGWLRDRL
jgi:penicillin-binding protein 1B